MLAVANSLIRSAPCAFEPVDKCADLFRRPGFLVDLRQGREQTGSGNRALSGHFAKIGVCRRAYALYRGEPAHQGGVEIGRGVKRRLLRGRFCAPARPLFVPAVFTEIPRRMHVGVDPAGHHGEAAEIDARFGLRTGSYAGDPSAFDGDVLVAKHPTPAINQSRCADDYSLCECRGPEEKSERKVSDVHRIYSLTRHNSRLVAARRHALQTANLSSGNNKRLIEVVYGGANMPRHQIKMASDLRDLAGAA